MYCSTEEVRDTFTLDALNALIGDEFIDDPEGREQHVAAIIEAGIADACGEIDGYLSKRYPVPLEPVPKVINKFAKDIAIYNLYSRIGIDEQGEEKNFLNRYHAAVKFLTLVAAGTVAIGAEQAGPATSAKAGFSMNASPRLFSRDSMKGM